MKLSTALSITTMILILLMLSTAQADGNHDSSTEDHMEVTVDVLVDSSIEVSLSVNPTDEMEARMRDHMGSGGMMGGTQYNMGDFSNKLTAYIFELREFVDVTGDGFTPDDVNVSSFVLSSSTLNSPVYDESSSFYRISSKDGNIFSMTIQVQTENSIQNAIKWSYDINYPYVQSNTSIAILSRVDTMEGEMNSDNMQDHMGTGNMGSGNMGENQGYHMGVNHMSDNNKNLPMDFSWDETAIVDGKVMNVDATLVENIHAITIPQGNNIYYDPKISFSVDDYNNVLSNIDSLFGNFGEQINSPSKESLIMASIVVISIAAITLALKKQIL